MAALTIPEFLARSEVLGHTLQGVLAEYSVLHAAYEDVRDMAIPEMNGAPGGNMGVNMNAADNTKEQIDNAFAGIMSVIEEICAVNNGNGNGNGNGNRNENIIEGGRRQRKRRARKTRRSRK